MKKINILLIALVAINIMTKNTYASEQVKWTGTIRDTAGAHNIGHDHSLRFAKSDDGSEYDISQSLDLAKTHCVNNKNYLVEIEAEKSDRFLFWGNNLSIKSYKILSEAKGETLTHATVKERVQTTRY